MQELIERLAKSKVKMLPSKPGPLGWEEVINITLSISERDTVIAALKATAENERLRYIIGALVEWRDKPWSPKGISVAGLTSHRETTNLDEQIEKARAETVSVWDAAREAIKKAADE